MRTLLALSIAFATSSTGCAVDVPAEERGSLETDLLAQGETLWPTRNGVATIEVCWGKALISPTRFAPHPEFGPAPGRLAELKKIVQAGAEREWNGRTPVRFVGWKECKGKLGDRVQLVPTDSISEHDTCPAGISCVAALGKSSAGTKVYLNLLFGDEFLYRSKYGATVSEETWDSREDLAVVRDGSVSFNPQACMDELSIPWTPWAVEPMFRGDINDPSVRAKADAIITSCIQNNTLHELGHVAGFAHEQHRGDDPAAQRACFDIITKRRLGSPDDLQFVSSTLMGNAPLGPFDPESIMSYCRTDKSAVLTEKDVAMTQLVYRGRDDGEAAAGLRGQDGADGASLFGGVGGKGGKGGESF